MNVEYFLYGAAQVRELDRRATVEHGIAGATLMARAATAAFRTLREYFPQAQRLGVVCGPGNNGGDGYVIARLAKEAGLNPLLLALGDGAKTSTDAATARTGAEAAGVVVQTFSAQKLTEVDVIVDALLGVGLDRPVQGEWRAAIDAINGSGKPVLAVDIPSGLRADTGTVMGAAVRAHATVSFIGLKAGLFTGAGREYAGTILFDDLGVPPGIYKGIQPLARRFSERDGSAYVVRRARDAHKGTFGHVLVVGGAPGMSGAARLGGEAAYRAGAGLVTLATHPAHAATINNERPELLVHGLRSARDVKAASARADVIALGPGLSQSSWAKTAFRAALAAKHPLVLDADALNLLAAKPFQRNDWILTPHPGEAARLLKTTVAKIQQDRFAAVHAIAKRYGGVCVLKGSGTLIAMAGDENIWLCDRGNPGMASGGTGDVLTGVIASLRAQGLGPLEAACLGVWVHASAADIVAQQTGEIGLLASDLFVHVRGELNRLARW